MSHSPRTLQDLVARLPDRRGRRCVGLRGAVGLRWRTRGELHGQAQRGAAWLAERSVGRGDRVVLWAPNGPEWVAGFLGAVLRGAVPVLLDPAQPEAAARAAAAEVGARLVLREEDLLAMAGHEGAPPAPVPLPVVEPGDVAAILWSSGTTGSPRPVPLSHAELIAQVLPFDRWRPLLSAVPLRLLVLPSASHVLGLVVGLLVPLWLGLAVVYTREVHAAGWIRAVRESRAAVVLAPPRALEVLEQALLRSSAGRARVPLQTELAGRAPGPRRRLLLLWRRRQVMGLLFRLFLVGGNRLPEGTARFWRRAGIAVTHGYGLTEAAGIVTLSHPFRSGGDAGRPLAGREVRLADDGEILVRGPAAATFLCTGDLGSFDREGRLVVRGRKKDVIVTGEGYNVDPAAVEEALNRQPGVRDSAVVGLGEAGAEEVHAALLLAPGAGAAEAVARANRELALPDRIRGWSVWPDEDLPRNSLLKVRRGEVRRRLPLPAAGGSAGPQAPFDLLLAEPDPRERLHRLALFLAGPAPDLGGAAGLRLREDLGLTSLDLVELLAAVENRGGLRSDEPFLDAGSTLADLRGQLHDPGRTPRRLPAGQPLWAMGPLVRSARPLVRRLAVEAWTLLGPGVEARWHTDPADLERSLLLAAAPHRHWLDAFAVWRCLPRRLRRNVMVVTNHEFREAFDPDPATPWGRRFYSAAGYTVGLPLLFCFAILSPNGRTREGLLRVARLLDRGYSPLTFPEGLRFGPPGRHDPGVALLARETGRPILPVHLVGNDRCRTWRWQGRPPSIQVHFGPPLHPRPDATLDDIVRQTEAALAALERAASG